MWTAATRAQHCRKTSRYRTNLTDEEWRVIEPQLPAANSTERPRTWPMREIINGIFLLCEAGGLSVASAAEQFAAVEHGLPLVCDVPRRRSLREDQPRPGYARSRTGRPPS